MELPFDAKISAIQGIGWGGTNYLLLSFSPKKIAAQLRYYHGNCHLVIASHVLSVPFQFEDSEVCFMPVEHAGQRQRYPSNHLDRTEVRELTLM
jgi:hypothetical protein